MSKHLIDLGKRTYEARARVGVQSGSKLKSRVTLRENVMGLEKRFDVIGGTKSRSRGSAEDVVPAHLANAGPLAKLTESSSWDYIDNFDEKATDVDAMRAYGYSHGKAVARDFDTKIIACLAAYNSEAYSHPGISGQRQVNIAANGKITAENWAEGMSMLMDYDYDLAMEDLTFVFPGTRYSDIVAEEKFSNRDYLGNWIGSGATPSQILGAVPIAVGNAIRTHWGGALSTTDKATADKRAYLFVRDAVGLAVSSLDNPAVIEWVPQKRSTLVGAECAAGCTRIENAGIIEFVFA